MPSEFSRLRLALGLVHFTSPTRWTWYGTVKPVPDSTVVHDSVAGHGSYPIQRYTVIAATLETICCLTDWLTHQLANDVHEQLVLPARHYGSVSPHESLYSLSRHLHEADEAATRKRTINMMKHIPARRRQSPFIDPYHVRCPDDMVSSTSNWSTTAQCESVMRAKRFSLSTKFNRTQPIQGSPGRVNTFGVACWLPCQEHKQHYRHYRSDIGGRSGLWLLTPIGTTQTACVLHLCMDLEYIFDGVSNNTRCHCKIPKYPTLHKKQTRNEKWWRDGDVIQRCFTYDMLWFLDFFET